MIPTASVILAIVAVLWVWASVVTVRRNCRDVHRMCERVRAELDRMDADRRKRITGGTE